MEGENRLGGSGSSAVDEQCSQPAGDIDETIVKRAGSGWNEGLVKLVEQRVSDDQGRRNQEPASADGRTWRRSKRPRRKEPENRVLREVCELSRDEVDGDESFGSRVWKQPENEWANDPGCVSSRKTTG